MDSYEQISSSKKSYKGNLHSHTVNSDGHLTPQESVQMFREHGYSFLCLSDHNVYTDYSSELDSEDFIILPGLEAGAYLCSEDGEIDLKCHHIHGILGSAKDRAAATAPLFSHKERLPAEIYYGHWDGAKAAQKLADKLKSRGCITMYNHPVWSRVRESEFIDTEGLWALEIYNSATVREDSTGYDTLHWDVMLRERKRIWGIATDDNHNRGPVSDACGGYICVQAPSLMHDDLIDTMKVGKFYSSSGPEIYSWGVDHGKAYISCSNVRFINFICGNHIGDGKTIFTDSVREEIRGGEYVLRGHETYIRAECIDWLGRCAWSNPIYLKEGCPDMEDYL